MLDSSPPSTIETFRTSLSTFLMATNPSYKFGVELISVWVQIKLEVWLLDWGGAERDQGLSVPHFVLSVIDIWFTLD